MLEAADRVGGRVFSQVSPSGVRIDHGGQWIGPSQHRFHALADRFGCRTFPTWETGRHIEIRADGTRVDYAGAHRTPDRASRSTNASPPCSTTSPAPSTSNSPGPPRGSRSSTPLSAEDFFRAQTDDEHALSDWRSRSRVSGAPNRARSPSSTCCSTWPRAAATNS
ncbi:FAD-dependent oxidoreductase [Streptomyces sp. L7]